MVAALQYIILVQKGAVTIIQVYAPTTDAADIEADEFYDQLQQEVSRAPRKDSLIVMGDFNAKAGIQSEEDREVMGIYGIGERNERGDRLLDFCHMNSLFITNTKFKNAKPTRCWTWESPDGKTRNRIDFILVNKSMLSSVQNSRAFPSMDTGSAHQLVMADIKLKLKKNRTLSMKFTFKLKDPSTREKSHEAVENKWEKLSHKRMFKYYGKR